MDEINNGLIKSKKKEEIRNTPYRICQKRKGAFPTKLKELIAERRKYQNLLQEEKSRPLSYEYNKKFVEYESRQTALKLLANAGYGVFAREDFEFSDYRVAELITGYGRLIHKQLDKLAALEKYGFETIFGFTDSIFIRNAKSVQSICSFIAECNMKFGIVLEHKNRFNNMIIFNKQNSFIAWTGESEDKPILKNLDGMSGRYPNWIKDKIATISTHLITNPYTDVISLIKQAFSELESGKVNTEDLMYTVKLSKEPSEYVNKNDRGKILGLQFAAHKGDIVYWYESDSKKRYSADPMDISIKKYKEILWNKIKDILEIANYNTEEIEQDLFIKDEIKVPRHQQVLSSNMMLL